MEESCSEAVGLVLMSFPLPPGPEPYRLRTCPLVLLVVLFSGLAIDFVAAAFAGPPFLTDDPEPVPFKNWEAYLFSTTDDARDQTNATGPAVELNGGVLPNLQLHLVIPIAYASPADGPRAYGLGDIEFGVKFRFLQETDHRPMVGVFPMVEIPSGSAERGLGNGRAWWKLPVWIQKSWGPWTSYGGGGYLINPAPGQRNYPFVGWLVQRNLGERLTLGAEIFGQGRSSDDTGAFAVVNLGGFFKITPDFQILFTAGHSVAGDRHTIGYLGLYWTGSLSKKSRPDTKETGPEPVTSRLRK
jgi:hypothetical protein